MGYLHQGSRRSNKKKRVVTFGERVDEHLFYTRKAVDHPKVTVHTFPKVLVAHREVKALACDLGKYWGAVSSSRVRKQPNRFIPSF